MRVVVADDSLLTRQGIVAILRESGMDVVGQAGDAGALLRQVEATGPDVVVVDLRMPPSHTDEGLQAALAIRDAYPSTGVVVLSAHLEASYAVQLLEAHSRGVGYLLKDRVVAADALADAITRVHAGEVVIDPSVVSALFAKPRTTDPMSMLTNREREVLALVAEGLSNRAIADRLFITERTVEAHISSIFLKLELDASQNAHRRVLAALAFLRG